LKTLKIVMSVLLFSVSIFMISNETAEATEFRTVKHVTSSNLNVKEEKTTNSKTLTTLPRGTHVTVFSDDGYWAHIEYKRIKGYVSSEFLEYSDSILQIASSKSGLVVKDIPSKSGKTVATLSYNMIVEEFDTENGWSFVQYGNITGYVATSFIGNANIVTKYVNSSGLIVRNIASQSGENIGALNFGEKVEVLSTLKGWSYIHNEDYSGYVVGSFLTNKDPNYVPVVIPSNNNSGSGYQTGFKNCTELRKVYPAGVSSSHPAYLPKFDRDKDNWGCE